MDTGIHRLMSVGQGITLGFQAWWNASLGAMGPHNAGSQQIMSPGDSNPKSYLPDTIAALKGFGATLTIRMMQPVNAHLQFKNT